MKFLRRYPVALLVLLVVFLVVPWHVHLAKHQTSWPDVANHAVTAALIIGVLGIMFKAQRRG